MVQRVEVEFGRSGLITAPCGVPRSVGCPPCSLNVALPVKTEGEQAPAEPRLSVVARPDRPVAELRHRLEPPNAPKNAQNAAQKTPLIALPVDFRMPVLHK